ncbi:MAG: hypothetical protein Q4P18_07155 [Methanobrevibacter sp.]|uniref:hypothetical protein n=1 Tax=Methanobrevibacter sp. TaxID=66852 RepID=UPI0026E09F10|nr:hypothetical protein [Methanobrevibacter sp.]MDO5849295.1 hypothetical protein [Methanobrevibacter sp.]
MFKNFKQNNIQIVKVSDGNKLLVDLVCDCDDSRIVYDEYHDEVFCLNCGTIIRQNFTVYHQLKARET